MDVYEPPTLVIDAVIFQIIDKTLNILLIRRTQEPFHGTWALPGGYNAKGETTHEAFARILRIKGGIPEDRLDLVEQLYTFDTVARDPRGHAVSVSYMGLGNGITPQTSTATQEPAFFPVNELPSLAFDHAGIIGYACERLKTSIRQTTAIAALMPPTFTLAELQSAHEAILGHPLDKRNFRKKILSFEVLADTGELTKEGAHRPAKLYKFTEVAGSPLSNNFD